MDRNGVLGLGHFFTEVSFKPHNPFSIRLFVVDLGIRLILFFDNKVEDKMVHRWV